MTILVSGASGLVGSHLCQRFVFEGHEVVGLVRIRENPILDSLVGYKNFKVCVGDIRREYMLDIMKANKVKTVFHLAAQMSYTPNNDLTDVNIQGSFNMLRCAHWGGVKEFIFASSMSVYSEPPQYLPIDEKHHINPTSLYGLTKLAGEFACRSYSQFMRTVILRYAGIYGRGCVESCAVAKFVRCALENKPISVFSDGKQSSDFTYVDDIVQGTVLAWEKKASGVFNIGSGSETTVAELANLILKLINSKSKIIFGEGQTDRPFRFFLDINKAREQLGYSPHLLEDGLRQYIEGE